MKKPEHPRLIRDFLSAFEFFKNHYAFTTSIFTLFLSTLCIIFSEFYFSQFSLDFYSFGSIGDIFRTPLSNGFNYFYMYFMILTSALILGRICYVRIFYNLDKSNNILFAKDVIWPEDLRGKFDTFINFLIVIFLAIIILSPVFLMPSDAERFATNIKNGFSARYNLKLNNDLIKCQAIIGSTSDYIFIFDYSSRNTKIIPRSQIYNIELVVESPPKMFLLVPRENIKKYNEVKNNILNFQRIWSEKLNSTCLQKVSWPILH